jgi:hypothetical protein
VATWQEVYRSDLQGLWALLPVPALFLLWLTLARQPAEPGVEPRAARFVRVWAVAFTVETILDPLLTGPLLRWLGVSGPLADNAMIPFVLLGDFRVFLLVFALAPPGRAFGNAVVEAAAWTLVVPAVALVGTAALRAVRGGLPDTILWLLYEAAFTVLALLLREGVVVRRVPADRAGLRAYLRAILGYVAAYYALWATADALILAGLDLGWALRMLPNQLYYSFWMPFAYAFFFAPRYAAVSTSVQTSR